MVRVKLEDAEPGAEAGQSVEHVYVLEREVLGDGEDGGEDEEEAEEVLKEALAELGLLGQVVPGQQQSEDNSKYHRQHVIPGQRHLLAHEQLHEDGSIREGVNSR